MLPVLSLELSVDSLCERGGVSCSEEDEAIALGTKRTLWRCLGLFDLCKGYVMSGTHHFSMDSTVDRALAIVLV